MRVLKFGGTSVGTAASLQQVKRIVEGRTGSLIVVVSALGGITDRLIEAAALAEKGDEAYIRAFEAICARVPFYLGTTLLRIARNGYLDRDYRRLLIREAELALRRDHP